MRDPDFDILDFFSPLFAGILSCILSAELNAFIPLELLGKHLKVVDAKSEFFIVPGIYFPELEFEHDLIVRRQVGKLLGES